jgi:predicted transcriptional regulator
MNITSSLSPELISRLDDYSRKFRIPKSRILEQALEAYFDRIKKAEYIRSFRMAAGDSEILLMAEEGLEDYLKILGEE